MGVILSDNCRQLLPVGSLNLQNTAKLRHAVKNPLINKVTPIYERKDNITSAVLSVRHIVTGSSRPTQ